MCLHRGNRPLGLNLHDLHNRVAALILEVAHPALLCAEAFCGEPVLDALEKPSELLSLKRDVRKQLRGLELDFAAKGELCLAAMRVEDDVAEQSVVHLVERHLCSLS